MVEGEDIAVNIVELGASGAVVRVPRLGLSADSVIWLAVELVSKGRPRTVVFTAYVGSVEDEYLTLAFPSGAIASDEFATINNHVVPTVSFTDEDDEYALRPVVMTRASS